MGTDSTNSIILFPDYQECKEKVDRLRTELSMLLLERDAAGVCDLQEH